MPDSTDPLNIGIERQSAHEIVGLIAEAVSKLNEAADLAWARDFDDVHRDITRAMTKACNAQGAALNIAWPAEERADDIPAIIAAIDGDPWAPRPAPAVSLVKAAPLIFDKGARFDI